MVKILQPDLPICLQYQDEFVCCRRSTLQNRHIFGNDLLFPGFGSSLTLALTCKSLAARVRCVVALTSQCSKLKAIKGVPFAPCKDPSKVPKSPILRSFQPITVVPLLESRKSGDWFSTQSVKVQFLKAPSYVMISRLIQQAWHNCQIFLSLQFQSVVHYISRLLLELPFEIL